MHRPAHALRRGAPAALVCVLVLLALTALLPPTRAAFSATTATPANTLSADQLAPPSGLSAVQTCSTPPLIEFRAATTATGTGSLTLTVPAGTASGDVLLAQVAHVSGAATLTVPSGWTPVRTDSNGSAVTSGLFLKTAAAGEPSAVFALPAGSTVRMGGGITSYTGVHPTNRLDVAATGVTGTGLTPFAPAVTTTTANTVLVRFITNDSASFPAPAGTNSRWQFTLGGGATAGVTAWDERFVGPGTAPARSAGASGSTSSNGIGQTVALRLGPGTPSAGLTWTASPSTWATGYRLERRVGGALQATRTITPVGTASTSDGPLANGTTYTYELRAERGTWRSEPVTATLTPAC